MRTTTNLLVKANAQRNSFFTVLFIFLLSGGFAGAQRQPAGNAVTSAMQTLPSLSVGVLPANPYCNGSSLSVPYTASGTYDKGNVFTAQLSDSTGSFANPITIGSLSSASSGTIQATLPLNADTVYYTDPKGNKAHYYVPLRGTKFRVRIVSSNPVVTGSDNGAELSITTPATYWHDNDGDGYGDASQSTNACGQPMGYVQNKNDCNDNDATINPNTVWVLDADNDGYYTGNPVTQCTSPGNGYVIKTSQRAGDCNDSEPSVQSPETYYVDADGDGFGSTTTAQLCSSVPPTGYSTDNFDCNDNDASINPNTLWVMDADKDGYYTGNPVAQCTIPDNGYVIKTNQISGDCNDDDATIHGPQTYYVDADGDGFGYSSPVQSCSSTAPAGYTNNNTDCNDGDAAVNPSTVWVLDADGDGYYTNIPVSQCTSPGAGYVMRTNQTGGDCNDGDAAIHESKLYYADNDGDGYGTANSADMYCSSTPPPGYSSNTLDCNDNDAAINPAMVWVLDADGDGYSTGNSVAQCTSPGSGYVIKTNQTAGDCNDSDAGVHAPLNYYADADKDGYGAGAAVQFCNSKPPAGYSANNLDCNDKKKGIHPGAKDGFDNIDNDCDGQIDEDYFQVSIANVKMNEGNSWQSDMNFTVSLTSTPVRTITVNYATQNGTATAGIDYIATSGTLTFAADVRQQTIAVPVIGDQIKETNETFKVVLSNPYNATLSRAMATGTIADDDRGKNSAVIARSFSRNAPDEVSSEQTVHLSPVPARSNLQVSLRGFSGKLLLKVFSIEGKQLKQQPVQSSGLSKLQNIDVSDLATGSYLLLVSDEKGNSKTEKFIVGR